MESYPFVSIIIPTIRGGEILERCLNSLAQQSYPKASFEIILLPDHKLDIAPKEGLTIIPGFSYEHKRNEGAKVAKGDLLGFVDDDCTMPENWLVAAVPYFADPKVAVVGGAALPFLRDTFWYRAGGYVLSSLFSSGFASSRYKKRQAPYESQEYGLLTANNVVRKEAFSAVGGFDPNQPLSEENDLYFRMKQKGYKLLHAPEIFVWHRAKPLFMPLARKTMFYATGRGVFMLRKPSSIRPIFFFPTLFALGIVLAPFAFWLFPWFRLPAALGFGAYIGLNIGNALLVFQKGERNPLAALAVFAATPLLHCTYGVGVLYGAYLFLRGQAGKGRNLWTSD